MPESVKYIDEEELNSHPADREQSTRWWGWGSVQSLQQQRKEEDKEGPGSYQEEVNVAKKRQEEERMQKEKARKVARKQLQMAAQLPPEPKNTTT